MQQNQTPQPAAPQQPEPLVAFPASTVQRIADIALETPTKYGQAILQLLQSGVMANQVAMPQQPEQTGGATVQ